MKKYLSVFLIFIVCIAGIIFLSSYKLTHEQYTMAWCIYIYFGILTLIFHYGIVRFTQARPQVFVRYYMGATTLKLLLHLGIIILYSFFHRTMATFFIITFMVMYLLFTVFEVIAVWRNIGN
jgi:hypothetical protein